MNAGSRSELARMALIVEFLDAHQCALLALSTTLNGRPHPSPGLQHIAPDQSESMKMRPFLSWLLTFVQQKS
jgi:succinate dehydrogenase hydrophobic anchor subunit